MDTANDLGVNISNITFKVNAHFYNYDELSLFSCGMPFEVNLNIPDHTLKMSK